MKVLAFKFQLRFKAKSSQARNMTPLFCLSSMSRAMAAGLFKRQRLRGKALLRMTLPAMQFCLHLWV